MLTYDDFIIKKLDTNLYAAYCKKTKDIICLEEWQVRCLPIALAIMEKIIKINRQTEKEDKRNETDLDNKIL